MDRIPIKTEPKLFDLAVSKLQTALGDNLSWLNHSFGLCERLTDRKDGKKFHSANLYVGEGRYEQIMPCAELGNFSFFYLRDPQEFGKSRNVIKSPFSLIVWYNMDSLSLAYDERNREAIKGQILSILSRPQFSAYVTLDKVYEKPEKVFEEFSYEHTNNQFLMSPYAGLRIDGEMMVSQTCPQVPYVERYDTRDATANASDLAVGKIAYNANGRFVGTGVIAALQEKSVTVTENGTMNVTPDADHNGMSKVTVATDVHPSESLDETITENGEKEWEGEYAGVKITVDVPEEKPEETLTETITENGTQTFNPTAGKVFDKAVITTDVQPTLQEAHIVPQTMPQALGPDPGYDGFDYIEVDAVTSDIDENIVAGNIKQGVSILGVNGSVVELNGQTKNYNISENGTTQIAPDADKNAITGGVITVNVQPDLEEKSATPSTSAQTILPSAGKDGLSKVEISAVTASIDANIVAENIKNNVTILGVTGNYRKYAYSDGSIDKEGLALIGWTAESIGMLGDNEKHYSWDNAQWVVSAANKALYGVVNKNNIFSYKTNADMIFCPMFDTAGVTSMANYFNEANQLKGIPKFDTSEVTNMSSMFNACSTLQAIPELDTSKVTNMQDMFRNCYSIQAIPELDTSKVTNMYRMFSGCSALQAIPELDTSKVTNMQNMLFNCLALQAIPELDTSEVTNMSSMFNACSTLQAIPELDTSKVTNMQNMFRNCFVLQSVPELDTSEVTNVDYMFYNCFALVTLNLTGSLNVTLSLAESTKLSYDSVKSVLTAASNTTNTNAKTLTFNRTLTDQGGELAALVALCTAKGWTISGLTLN